MLGRILTKDGHNVTFADNGEEVLSLIAVMQGSAKSGSQPFKAVDVVLMDRNLSKLDGPNTAR